MQKAHFSVLRTTLPHRRGESTHAQQVVGRAHDVGVQLYAGESAHQRATKSAVSLHPAEDLLDAFALALAHRVARMTRGARVQPRGPAAFDSRDAWRDVAAAQVGE